MLIFQLILALLLIAPSLASDNTTAINSVNTPVGVTENIGLKIPLDLIFTDENDHKKSLSQIIDRPTLLLPVYFSCPASCPLQLANLAHSLNRVIPVAGKDYKVIALSFDEQDTPAYAKQAKANYMGILKNNFPVEAWPFLVGDKAAITALTEAMGYSFQKTAPHQFTHPNVLACLAPDGQIIRYIYGPDFLPLDLSMAIGEAEKGTPGISIRKLLNYCFSYDPDNKKYVFNTFRILGVSSILILGLFYLLVLRKGNKPMDKG